MLIAPEEKSSRGPLVTFIDLLFLLIALFTLLLFFLQQREAISQQQMEAVQQQIAKVTGEQVDVPQAIETLEKVVERFVTTREQQQALEREAAARRERRAERTLVRLEYTLDAKGNIVYDKRTYTTRQFLEQVVVPLRKEHWVAFRAYAAPDTPFGSVVAHRRVLLRDSNEFDTYWDNVTREERKPAQ